MRISKEKRIKVDELVTEWWELYDKVCPVISTASLAWIDIDECIEEHSEGCSERMLEIEKEIAKIVGKNNVGKEIFG